MDDQAQFHGALAALPILLAAIVATGRLDAVTPPKTATATPPASAQAGLQAGGSAHRPVSPSAATVQASTNDPAVTASLADPQVEKRVRAALSDDPHTRRFAAQALVENGCVTLAGHTYYKADRELAERTVSKLAGVRSVRNEILVEPNADLEIAQELHAAFSKDPLVDDAAISVTVIDRKVFLCGTVDSDDKFARVNQIVQKIPGVAGVNNGLKLSASPKQWRPLPATRYSVYQPGRR